MDSSSASALETVLTGEAQKLLHTHTAQILAKYGSIKPEIEKLKEALDHSSMTYVVKKARRDLDPLVDDFDPTSKAGLSDLSLFRFIGAVGSRLVNYVSESNNRIQLMQSCCDLLLPALNNTADLTAIVMAEEAGSQLLVVAAHEYKSTVLDFEDLLAGIYLATRSEYKKLRNKFLGGSLNLSENNDDDVEDQLLFSLFGAKPPKKEGSGPAVPLVDDNCILTQLLIDMQNNLPRYYQKITPVLKRGKLTGKTVTTKTLDAGEVEDWAGTMRLVASPTYWRYVNSPSDLTKTILNIIQSFQREYGTIAAALQALVMKANLHLNDRNRRLVIEDPTALVKQYSRINFLAIRPSAEDITPRTKMDQDISVARTKLFVHLKETLDNLSGMDRHHQTTEDFAIAKIEEAVVLHQAILDIERTEDQRNLARNIQDDNEFYVGQSGQIGSLGVVREPAPKIRYEDVVGNSFTILKQHVEEVIKVASHPHIMRLSAPRGDVRSNVLAIGPYGCGKSEIAKAIGGDKRIIGFNVAVADLLTAYMHESVKNVKRMYDHAKDLRRKSRCTKPVAILLDEFDRLFNYGEGVHAAYDGGRMTGVLQEMMDGIVGYEGVFLVALTNVPKEIPEAILRRFKYVDVVGSLTQEERAHLFKMFLTRGLPIDPAVTEENYMKWADLLNHAPGDVIGKVTDEIHFKFMHDLVHNQPAKIGAIEKSLGKRLKDREATKKDYAYLKKALATYKIISGEDITTALETVIAQPQVKMQINKAKQVYRDAEDIMKGLSDINSSGLGFNTTKKSVVWSANS
jgi:SpoVK/Ycf46/Vps4 family AAA+-type ATPase